MVGLGLLSVHIPNASSKRTVKMVKQTSHFRTPEGKWPTCIGQQKSTQFERTSWQVWANCLRPGFWPPCVPRGIRHLCPQQRGGGETEHHLATGGPLLQRPDQGESLAKGSKSNRDKVSDSKLVFQRLPAPLFARDVSVFRKNGTPKAGDFTFAWSQGRCPKQAAHRCINDGIKFGHVALLPYLMIKKHRPDQSKGNQGLTANNSVFKR